MALFLSVIRSTINSEVILRSIMNKKAREKARTFGIQALYQWHYNPVALSELEAEFQARNDYHQHVDWDFFHDILSAVMDNLPAMDEAIIEAAQRPLKEMNPTELAILRAASAELKMRLDVPYQVVLSEYVDLTASFGATDAHSFVNAVLDRLSQHYRNLERSAP